VRHFAYQHYSQVWQCSPKLAELTYEFVVVNQMQDGIPKLSIIGVNLTILEGKLYQN